MRPVDVEMVRGGRGGSTDRLKSMATYWERCVRDLEGPPEAEVISGSVRGKWAAPPLTRVGSPPPPPPPGIAGDPISDMLYLFAMLCAQMYAPRRNKST